MTPRTAVRQVSIVSFAVAILLAGVAPTGADDQLGHATAPGGSTSEYFVAADGDDLGPGSLTQPWQSIQESLGRLEPGDTLWVRGGTYWESEIQLGGVQGTTQAPITIQAYPGETPVIDGGYPEFRAIGNNDWELVDTREIPAERNVYRSVKTYPDATVRGKFEYDGQLYALAPYKRLESLASEDIFHDSRDTNGDINAYFGPGVVQVDGRIYVRMEPAPAKALDEFAVDFPTDVDPRQSQLFLGSTSSGRHGFVTSGSTPASHLVLDGIDVQFHDKGVRFLGAGGNDIVIRNSTWTPMRAAMLFDRVDGILVDNVDFVLGFPQWIAWSDIKHSNKDVLREYKLTGISGPSGDSRGIEVRHSRFDRVFDGIVGFGNFTDIHVHHNDFITFDDAFQVRESASHVEFAYNRVDGPGISHYGPASGAENAERGTVWVHHNIVDATRPILRKRRHVNSDIEYEPLRIFPTHGGTYFGNPWKIYNNTLIGASNSSTGIEGAGKNDTGVAHEVYNNIIVTDDRWVTRKVRVDRQDVYDGNAYWQAADMSPTYFEIRNGEDRQNFATLAEFKASDWWEDTRSYYAPGWEASGIEGVDPRLDGRCIPGNSTVWTGGVDLSDSNLPGVDGTYRGAIRPGTDGSQVGAGSARPMPLACSPASALASVGGSIAPTATTSMVR